MSDKRKILVTSALPYANGPLHLGHMVEYIQSDIWVRLQRMRGHEVWFVCADDAHGTPIMLNARKQGITPEQLIEKVGAGHRADFEAFGISFDHFSSTHTPTNRELASAIFLKLKDNGHIVERTIKQLYDPQEEMFLPDRFVRGECPKCAAEDQYGDSCEVCGATYAPRDLKNPRSSVSGATPVLRETLHYFVQLSDFEDMLRKWTRNDSLQREVSNKLQEWFEAGLKDWDITRDRPYFGFPVPGTDDKFLYVWVDAPVGYMASFRELCERRGLDFDAWWRAGSEHELYHFIGKDIIYFHTLFWPAMLHGAGYRRPTAVFAHGFLTINGQKMSKSRGTFIMARSYLDRFAADYLRYYFAAKLGSGLSDIDLNLTDLAQKVNADLVGKVVNIASRCAGFIAKRFDGRLAGSLPDPDLFERFATEAETIAGQFEAREYNQAIRAIMALADEANRYIDEKRPWELIKQNGQEQVVHEVCTQGINLFRTLMVYLKPVLPHTAARAEAFLAAGELLWTDAAQPLLDHPIEAFKPLLTRLDEDEVLALAETTQAQPEGGTEAQSGSDPEGGPLESEIEIGQFSAVDLRVARIAAADYVEGADKLLRLELDLGGQTRQVFAGIRAAYKPEELVDRLTVMVANLKPRKMRFGLSEGMVLAAGPGGEELFILSPDSGARPGMRVK